MEIGRRVLIPDSFQFTKKYREMRKVGRYPEALPYALVLAFLETEPPPNSYQHLNAFQGVLSNEVFQYSNTCPTSAAISERLESQEFVSEFQARCNEVFKANGIPIVTDGVLSNADQLCAALRVKLEIHMGGMEHSLGVFSTLPVAIGVYNRTCFVLYKRFTRESFVILSCGHIQLRYHLMKKLQNAAQNQAISASDPLDIVLCEEECGSGICGLRYSPDIFRFAESLARDEHIATLSQPFSEPITSFLMCIVCHRYIAMNEMLQYCRCSNTVCYQCAAIERMAKDKAQCPACLELLSNPAQFDYSVRTLKIEQELLLMSGVTVKPVGKQAAVTTKYCSSCRREHELSHYLDIGDHLNCWVCSKCVATALQQGNCPRCKKAYDREAVTVQMAEEEKKSVVKPTIGSKSEESSQDPEEYKTTPFHPPQSPLPSRSITCSKCKKVSRATSWHKCSTNEVVCIDCCLTDAVTRFTSIEGRCSTCRGKFEPELGIDLELQIYPCTKCGKQLSLLEAVHRCPDSSMWCEECAGFSTHSAAQNCSQCNKVLYDKYMRKRGRQ